MGAARGARDRQIELFHKVDEVQKQNIGLLTKQVHDIEDEINFTVRGQYLLSDIFEEYSPSEITGMAAQVRNLIDDLQAIPSDLPIEPLPTLRIRFETKMEKNFFKAAKCFGKLNFKEVELSLLPKDPKTIDFDSDEENMLPIDNSELSKIVHEQLAEVSY